MKDHVGPLWGDGDPVVLLVTYFQAEFFFVPFSRLAFVGYDDGYINYRLNHSTILGAHLFRVIT
jgi:hypothetical protein